MAAQNTAETLSDLRTEIDRIDAGMHALLMERGEIIDRIIAAKARQGGGSAFHPGREAAMMRALAERHQGKLPLDTVESIWRVIISTFTFIQMNYSVHADISGGDPMMRDTARFHFGFTVPYVMHNEAAGVIAAVARSFGDLGMLRVDSGATAGAWWMRLVDPAAPKVIARLPFVERPDHPAGIPVFVIARPLAEAAARGVVLHAVSVERWRENIPAAIARLSGEIIGNAGHGFGLSLLIALPGGVAADELRSALAGAGVGELRLAEIGSHAARFEMAERAGDERYRAAE
ncbi:MAG: chorismate mutase [Methylobacteriaceae bacterium]|nr:chorismate mutase [Methylobacteriaceae bacterium]